MTLIKKLFRLVGCVVALVLGLASHGVVRTCGAAPLADVYKVEDIAFPDGVPPEVGGLDFDANGMLYVALRRGDIIVARPQSDPAGFEWRLFATGFHNGCGLVASEPGRVLVSQMAELTEATDTDGDGRADRYRTVADEWGLSGNYHETNALCGDGRGGYFLAIGTASYNGPTFVYTKGVYSPTGRRGRNFSAVKYRGWTLHLRADGRMEPYASGFRVNNGLTVDDEGNLWSADNQGDWKAATPFYHIRKDRFYGHPSSLVWDERWPEDKDPLATFRNDLAAYNRHRTPAAVQIPHRELVRSGAEPLQLPRDGRFGPFGGQFLLPDIAGERFSRIMVEKVGGEYQGAATLWMDGFGLRRGGNRLRLGPDGRSIYIGQSVRGWGQPSEGLQRITWRGGVPFTIETMHITRSGFRLVFTAPLGPAAAEQESYRVRSMVYQPRWTYGSAPEDVRDEPLDRAKMLNEREVELTLRTMAPGRVYHLELGETVQSTGNETPAYRDFYYTANRLPAR